MSVDTLLDNAILNIKNSWIPTLSTMADIQINNRSSVDAKFDLANSSDGTWSNGYVTLLEVTEHFWRLLRTVKRLEILSQNFKVTSAESLNYV